ncbi:hypothetical protein CLAFUW4_00441 [Fulvia fulva]|uniref:Uncharacterized protein n=1 Tax=Passalora fulva TaxID=5499 RepID=A0A9Q8L6Z2_PASFU|nr:uncharacterized protein CLAFUR5_00443 [Fulvia fulva]KAK4636125.1 hypothetical protein CLAFUR4_00441 [Fulvia fulva]KAK4637238.1 hypothetical protein CLAFUR0_00442 [Fulvia fulva]UJO11988.1 hypothetical protein CLAFUR5_00443 [Fulvia fulva]WPV08779.1 hypothetical protein CLAFUW4_00441 [Fulvia fulva]WPV24565.1 hypothetical protein CLAFUW7_00445 [Fulvia fulva]
MAGKQHQPHWLHRYGNNEGYQWRETQSPSGKVFSRPLGPVEFSFDADGRYYEGKADMNCLLEVQITSKLSRVDLRERLLLAWTRMRCRHLLLQARTCRENDDDPASTAILGMHFQVKIPRNVGHAIEDAGWHLIFLEDYYDEVDTKDFYAHCKNVGRIVDPEQSLSKLFVLPVKGVNGRTVLRLQFVMAHQISDGLCSYAWMNDFINILNESPDAMRQGIATSIRPESMAQHLPLPQEALYPKITGSIARQRWFWAITRMLRHVRKPLPVGFSNPLQRQQVAESAVPLSPVYKRVLDYTKTPVLNTFPSYIHISATSTARLSRICKSVKTSLGAGIYALAALIMMEFHERRYPDVPANGRDCFITGFPLNPRAFFNFHNEPDSMMLAFSDGIALPFLSSDLDLEGRLRLLARQAQRQLATYQKRARPTGDDATKQFLSSRGAGLVLANQYLFSLERAEVQTPAHLRSGLDVQGQYPARQNPTMQTCGVSSVGNREALVKGGLYDLDDPSKDFAADFTDMTSSVRAREGEFLVGIGGTKDGLFCVPSVDSTRLDPALVQAWCKRFETALDEESTARL